MIRLFLSLLLLGCLASAVQAQVSLTPFSTTVSNETKTATSPGSTAFTVGPSDRVSILTEISAASAGSSNVTFYIQVSLDGTVWTTDYPISWTVTTSGTNLVRNIAAFPNNFGARYISLDKITSTHTNTVTISKLIVYTAKP